MNKVLKKENTNKSLNTERIIFLQKERSITIRNIYIKCFGLVFVFISIIFSCNYSISIKILSIPLMVLLLLIFFDILFLVYIIVQLYNVKNEQNKEESK